jgi:hypothetical protein
MPSPPLSDPLSRALDGAIAGRTSALFDLLARGSRLPGIRANDSLADAFAQACRARGAPADAVGLRMARLSADEAPGATPLEFLPVCGLLALAARGAVDEGVRARVVAELHAHADDLRFRVRDAVVEALARVGEAGGDALVEAVAPWMDGYFHAAAVVRALSREPWLGRLHEGGPVIARLDEAFALARDAPRAAARYPGHKALLEALEEGSERITLRFGVPVLDALVRWAATQHPVLRALVARTAQSRRLSRFGPDLQRVRAALSASEPAPRNPDHDFGPSRDRSHRRRR